MESINIACHWGYKDVQSGETLNGNVTFQFSTAYINFSSSILAIPVTIIFAPIKAGQLFGSFFPNSLHYDSCPHHKK